VPSVGKQERRRGTGSHGSETNGESPRRCPLRINLVFLRSSFVVVARLRLHCSRPMRERSVRATSAACLRVGQPNVEGDRHLRAGWRQRLKSSVDRCLDRERAWQHLAQPQRLFRRARSTPCYDYSVQRHAVRTGLMGLLADQLVVDYPGPATEVQGMAKAKVVR